MGSLGPLCCRLLGRVSWAPVWACIRGQTVLPGLFTGFVFLLILLRGLEKWAYASIFEPDQLPPSPWLQRAWARAILFLGSGAISTWLLRGSLIRASPSYHVL